MENYKEYSYNAFVALKEQQKENGFAFYQPHENAAFYANRYGQVLTWRCSKSGNTITIKSVKYPMPSELSADDYKWLRRIAKHKHWRGGVQKIDYYLTLTPDEIDARGIDPYFYAWLAQYHYSKKSEVDYTETHQTILSQKEYDEVVDLSKTLNGEFDDLLESRLLAKENGVTSDEFILTCIKISQTMREEEPNLVKAYRFVDMIVGDKLDEGSKDAVARDIIDLIQDAVDNYNSPENE